MRQVSRPDAVAPCSTTCEGGLYSLILLVWSLRGAQLPGNRDLDASLMGAEGHSGERSAREGLALGLCFFPVAFRARMGEDGRAREATRGAASTSRALAATARAMCTSRFKVGPLRPRVCVKKREI